MSIKSILPEIYSYTAKSFLIATISFQSLIFSQGLPSSPDSLEKLLKTETTDTARANILNELAFKIRSAEPEKSLTFANEALEISREIGFPEGEGKALTNFGNYFSSIGEYDKALQNHKQALVIRQKFGAKKQIASSFNNIGQVLRLMGHYKRALDSTFSSFEIYKGIQDTAGTAMASSNLGIIFKEKGDFKESSNYLSIAFRLREMLKDSLGMAKVYTNFGNLYESRGDLEKALNAHRKALDILEKKRNLKETANALNNIGNIYLKEDSLEIAIDYYSKSLELKELIKDNQGIAGTLANIGLTKEKQGKIEEAIQNLNQSLEIMERIQNRKGIAEDLCNLGRIYMSKGNIPKAMNYLTKALPLAEDLRLKPLLLEVYKNLCHVYFQKKDYASAYMFSRKYNALTEEIFENYIKSRHLEDAIEEERRKTLLVQKDLAIKTALLNESQAKNNGKNILIISLFGLSILLTLLMISIVRAIKQKQRILSAEKKEAETQARIDTLVKDQELKMLYSNLDGQEKERKRIAEVLHDSLGALLASVKLHFKSAEKTVTEKAKIESESWKIASDLLDKASEEVRQISHNLVSGTLLTFGLEKAVAFLGETIQKSGQIKVNLIFHGLENRLSYEMEINIYRIIQELGTNILKHSQALEITLQIVRNDNMLNILVEDNGIGFNPNALGTKRGIGLKTIESRIIALSGEMNIDSGKGNGTTFSIDIPVKN